MEKIRRRYRFRGRVQGVGFRYYAYHSAEYLGLTGWVQNCYDGSVLAEVQGCAAAVEEFPGRMAQGRYIMIEEVEKTDVPIQDERGFSIRT